MSQMNENNWGKKHTLQLPSLFTLSTTLLLQIAPSKYSSFFSSILEIPRQSKKLLECRSRKTSNRIQTSARRKRHNRSNGNGASSRTIESKSFCKHTYQWKFLSISVYIKNGMELMEMKKNIFIKTISALVVCSTFQYMYIWISWIPNSTQYAQAHCLCVLISMWWDDGYTRHVVCCCNKIILIKAISKHFSLYTHSHTHKRTHIMYFGIVSKTTVTSIVPSSTVWIWAASNSKKPTPGLLCSERYSMDIVVHIGRSHETRRAFKSWYIKHDCVSLAITQMASTPELHSAFYIYFSSIFCLPVRVCGGGAVFVCICVSMPFNLQHKHMYNTQKQNTFNNNKIFVLSFVVPGCCCWCCCRYRCWCRCRCYCTHCASFPPY